MIVAGATTRNGGEEANGREERNEIGREGGREGWGRAERVK